MATKNVTIKPKHGTTVPVAGNLVAGELAIKTDTGDLYTMTDGGTIVKIGPSSGSSGGLDLVSYTFAGGL